MAAYGGRRHVNHRALTQLKKRPHPSKSYAPRDQRLPPLFTLLSNNSEMPKGWLQRPPFPPILIFHFLDFPKYASGFGDQQPSQAQENHETADGRPETSRQ